MFSQRPSMPDSVTASRWATPGWPVSDPKSASCGLSASDVWATDRMVAHYTRGELAAPPGGGRRHLLRAIGEPLSVTGLWGASPRSRPSAAPPCPSGPGAPGRAARPVAFPPPRGVGPRPKRLHATLRDAPGRTEPHRQALVVLAGLVADQALARPACSGGYAAEREDRPTRRAGGDRGGWCVPARL